MAEFNAKKSKKPKRLKLCSTCPPSKYSVIYSWKGSSTGAFGNDRNWDTCRVGGACGAKCFEYWEVDEAGSFVSGLKKAPSHVSSAAGTGAEHVNVQTEHQERRLCQDRQVNTSGKVASADDDDAQVKVCRDCGPKRAILITSWRAPAAFEGMSHCRECQGPMLLFRKPNPVEIGEYTYGTQDRPKRLKMCQLYDHGAIYSWKGDFQSVFDNTMTEARQRCTDRYGCRADLLDFWECNEEGTLVSGPKRSGSTPLQIQRTNSYRPLQPVTQSLAKRTRQDHGMDANDTGTAKKARLDVAQQDTQTVNRATDIAYSRRQSNISTASGSLSISGTSETEPQKVPEHRRGSDSIYTQRNGRVWDKMSETRSSMTRLSTARSTPDVPDIGDLGLTVAARLPPGTNATQATTQSPDMHLAAFKAPITTRAVLAEFETAQNASATSTTNLSSDNNATTNTRPAALVSTAASMTTLPIHPLPAKPPVNAPQDKETTAETIVEKENVRPSTPGAAETIPDEENACSITQHALVLEDREVVESPMQETNNEGDKPEEQQEGSPQSDTSPLIDYGIPADMYFDKFGLLRFKPETLPAFLRTTAAPM